MAVFAADIETTGLLDMMREQKNPKLHNFCAIEVDTGETVLFEGTQRKRLQEFLNQGHTLIMHNGKLFDMEALILLGYDVSKVKLIDSLALSWYLEPTRMRHGLAEYGEEFGVPKPLIEDWENQTQEEYNHRVQEDCKIQRKLWKRQVSRLQELYGKEEGSYDRIVGYLMWKMDCLVMQQRNKWKIDVPSALKLQEHLQTEIDKKTEALRQVMPKVAIYAVKSRPAKPYKKNGELSSTGEKWKELTESLGLPFEHKEDIKVVKEYVEGNPASHVQMKAWLDSLGWEPETFKFIREDDGSTRQIPQINLKGGEICQSVKDLIPKCQGIEHIAGLGILNHRLSVVSGWLRDATNGELTARAQGFTNTLRKMHKEYCNTPSTRVPYGAELRSLLVAREGRVLCGSDLSGVENFIKNHYQWPFDPEYVKTQLDPNYDPHLDIAISAGMISKEDSDWYKWYKKNKDQHNDKDDVRFETLDAIRATGKSTNYACLPLDNTAVLTKRGWLRGSDILVGDVVMGYNKQTGFNEWCEVTHTHFYKEAQVEEWGHTNWSAESTPNHRWHGSVLKQIGATCKKHKKFFVDCVRQTSELGQTFNILNTAEFNNKESGSVSSDEASLVAWILADGYYKWSELSEKTSSSGGKKKGLVASIAQASHKYQDEIRVVLSKNNIRWKEDALSSMNENTITSFRLNAGDMRAFFDRVVGCRKQKHDVDWVDWVLKLGKDSLKSFVHAFWLADGDSKGNELKKHMVFKQNRGNIADALVVAGYLCGYNVTQRGPERTSTIRFQKRRKHTTCQRFKLISSRTADVFCLTTTLDSFVIRQNGMITITGNCQYGSGVKTLARTAKVSEKVAKKLHEGYNKLNWSVAKIASSTKVKKTAFGDWQQNPINKFWYSLRNEKDRFSTLVQGTAAYVFDIWLYHCHQLAKKRGVEYCLLAQSHDDQALELDIGSEEITEKLLRDALKKVNDVLKLNVEIKCDVMFGYNGKEIH